uniref:B3 domain-containing protein Os11g0197600-like isoform X2 n=1 Tax=Nicotiana tabacum TaxID=4097 RepID=A0A1S4A7S7_TOBAC|nr:PREDICTED: B3 domain-containing protein Os11g0197600-like isoform X2 [Nicotiana tabacum]
MAAKPHLQSGEGSSHWKSSTNITQPKFFKIILSQHERSRLVYCRIFSRKTGIFYCDSRSMKLSLDLLCTQRIPEDFASRYCKNMLNPVYLEVPSGEVWEVEVVHSQGRICLGIGWQDFSDFYSISCGDFLMFGYNARSHFNVTIFDLSASEIEYPYSSVHGIHTPISYCHETRHAPKRDQSGSDDSVEILEGIPRSQKAKAKIPDTVEHSVENLGQCPLGQSSKRKRQKGDAEHDASVDMHVKRMKVEKLQEDVASPSFIREGQNHGEGTEIEHSLEILDHCPSGHGSKRKGLEGDAEDDVSTDIHTRSIKVEKSRENVASPSFTRKTKKSGESCRMHKQQSKLVSAKNKTVLEKKRSIAYQRARAFKSENPFVIYFMQPSYVSKPYNLHISFLFARKYFPEECGNLVLRVPSRGSWTVKYVVGRSKAEIRFCWKAFVLDNKLKFGDVCVFELIKGTKPILDATIFPAAESKAKHKIDGKLPDVSDCKNKIIKTENSEDAGKHVQQSKSSCKGRVVAKEMVIAYQRAKAFKSENPFFVCFMQPSYVSSACGPMRLSITLSRARKFFATRHSDVVLQVSSKKSWAVKCILGPANAKLTSGWKDFVLDNNLKVGDVCVFERVSRSKLLFNVIIYTSAEGI